MEKVTFADKQFAKWTDNLNSINLAYTYADLVREFQEFLGKNIRNSTWFETRTKVRKDKIFECILVAEGYNTSTKLNLFVEHFSKMPGICIKKCVSEETCYSIHNERTGMAYGVFSLEYIPVKNKGFGFSRFELYIFPN